MRQTQHFSQSLPNSASPDKSASTKGDDRGVLLAASELFAGRTRHDVEEKRIFLELASNFLPKTSLPDRRRIANLLAAHPEIPDDLLTQLASDEDELTAYPALRYSPRLSVDLLLKVAEAGPDSLRKAVANRPSLRESVITTLCEHAGAPVIRILLDREDVTLTQAHQAKLSCRSDIVATLGLELAGQDALNPDGLMGQFLHLPAPLKSKAIAAAEMTSLVKQAQTPGSGTDRRTDTARLKLRDALVSEALFQQRSRFADLLGQGLGLPQTTCDLLMHDDQAEGLTVALKALGMSASEVTTVMIRMLGENLSLERLRGLLRLHRTLSQGAAEVLVGQWILHDQVTQPVSAQLDSQYQDGSRRDVATTDGQKFGFVQAETTRKSNRS
ncbi:DUF2336 domain-containing protein [Roseibium aggregatum]|uniref:DUF2336 domain-containing protein n=1 Tax=Roseibium aggregatum TaxID=187304 RepID=UPI001E601224|nr:DUF2336 domain-containing protein [Roseibium aggregatum]UES39925.1 DUF2336 domain-containing protein [Roseibium aggregatum]